MVKIELLYDFHQFFNLTRFQVQDNYLVNYMKLQTVNDRLYIVDFNSTPKYFDIVIEEDESSGRL